MADVLEENYLVAVVGGGAAGLAAAISAAQTWYQAKSPQQDRANPETGGQAPVVILEKLDRPGKKLLATGNGRCNLSNSLLEPTSYHGNDPRFARGALSRMNVDLTLQWFSRIGLPCRTESDGRIFPESLQASSVIDILRRELQRLQVEIRTGCDVRSISIQSNKEKSWFVIKDSTGKAINARKVILATGGKAAPAFGCDGSGYDLAGGLGHNATGTFPALVQVKTESSWNKGLAGSKFTGRISLVREKILRSEEGEILFTSYGISGPPVLQISRLISKQVNRHDSREKLTVRLDFLPDWTEEQLRNWFDQRQHHDPELELADFLSGLIAKKIGRALIKLAVSRPLSALAASLTTAEKIKLSKIIKGAELSTAGTLGWEQAQVTAGGLATKQFSPATMESKLIPGLFAAGEILDIDGDCGGFNLQWAWSSGIIAGSSSMMDAIG